MVLAGMTTEPPDHSDNLAAELSRIEAMISAPETRKITSQNRTRHTGIRPRNASTLVIVRKEGSGIRVLMGKRHHSLKFMPGALVFPGGSVDKSDGMVPSCDEMAPETARLLVAHMRGRKSIRGARALAMAAIRELAEESGLLLGKSASRRAMPQGWEPFEEHAIMPALSGLSVMARAITPPGPPRRFDTWFFVTMAERIGYTPDGGFLPSGELEELQWIRPQDALEAGTREITRVMLVELLQRLERDPELDPSQPVPFYQSINRQFRKSVMA